MQLLSFSSMKPSMRIALIIVVIGGALFLLAPLFFGTPQGYKIDARDHISSWSWKGAYADGGQLQGIAEKEIQTLESQKGKGGIADYDLNVGLASQYELLGDGKSAYQYLSKAIAADPKRGLAYLNMAHLMEEMGAFYTAHTAYDAAVAAEPTNPVYKTAQQQFLIQHPGT